MPPPIGKTRLLIPALADFLETNTATYVDPNLDYSWRYYKETIAPGDNPQGLITVINAIPSQAQFIDYHPKQLELTARLLVAHEDSQILLSLLGDWHDVLWETFVKLRTVGYNGLFRGVGIRSSEMRPQLNQDNGAIGAVIFKLSWSNDGLT